MEPPTAGRVRPIRADEVDRWCGAPLPASHPRFAAWRDGERAWVARWQTPADRLVVFETAEGDLPGKYDVPIVKARGWSLWAPTVRPGPGAETVLDALCAHQVARARRREVASVELLLEEGHWLPDLARAAVLRAGFAFFEEAVVVSIDLARPLPAATVAVDVRPAAALPEAELRALCHAAGIPHADDEELAPNAPGLALGVVALWGDRPVGLALAQSSRDPRELLDHGVGVVPEARGRGVGRTLVRAFLARAQARGAASYVASTAADNRAMRAVFDSLGAEVVARRSVFRWAP